MRIRRGFTLAELMVVIGIIVVLLSILLPAVHGARESARSAQCASNVRTILQAMTAYATAYDGVLPAAAFVQTSDYWKMGANTRLAYFFDPKSKNPPNIEFDHGAIMRYLGNETTRRSIMRCPNADDGTSNYSYVLHAQLKITDGNIRAFQVVRPERKIIVFEDDNPNDGHIDLAIQDDQSEISIHHFRTHSNAGRSSSPTQRLVGQLGRGNYGFADGHVESITAAELYQQRNNYLDLLK